MARLSLLVLLVCVNIDYALARINSDSLFYSTSIEEESRVSQRDLVEMANFQLKMYYQPGYDWKDTNVTMNSPNIFDVRKEGNSIASKAWCATCLVKGCAWGSVVLAKCNKNNKDQKWRSRGGKLKTYSNKEQCLSYIEGERMTIKPCTDSNDKHQLITLESFSGSKIQIRANKANNKCITSQGKPSADGRLRLQTCSKALDNDTAYWQKVTLSGTSGCGKAALRRFFL